MTTGRSRSLMVFIIWYIAALLLFCVALSASMLLRGVGPERVLLRLPKTAHFVISNYATWILAFVPYVLFLLFRSLLRTYRSGGVNPFLRALSMRVALPAIALVGLWYCLHAYTAETDLHYRRDTSVENHTNHTRGLFEADGKQRGVNFIAVKPVSREQLQEMVKDNIEWITLVPFGWQQAAGSPDLHVNSGTDYYWSETDSGIAQITGLARGYGMKLMLKPQIWLTGRGNGASVSDIGFGSDRAWDSWFEQYREFIFHYALLAQRLHIEMLCIGTELHTAAKARPGAWRGLIGGLRKVYSGKLTYAANWTRELEDISFWDALDYIGVQAYYPLSSGPDPTVEKLLRAWQPYADSLGRISARYGKPILFTEIGWKSTADATMRPWEWTETLNGLFVRVSTGTQAVAYESFFRTFWNKKWFAGAHLWKWYANHDRAGGPSDIDFTPQNKPAENIIARWFGTVAQ